MASTVNSAHKRDASLGADLSDAPAPKAAKLLDDAHASTHDTTELTDSCLQDAASANDEAPAGQEAGIKRAASTSVEAEPKHAGKEQHQDLDQTVNGEDGASNQGFLVVKEHVGDLFSAPDNAVIAHACNTVGSWGGGIAVEFRKRYPHAFKIYNKHCVADHDPKKNPVQRGTCLLIPPCEDGPDAPKHWIGCLFTSAKYGRAKDPPKVILHHTPGAVKDLLVQMRQSPGITELRMCQINAGLFAVPWKDTRKALEDIVVTDACKEVHVYTLANASSSSNAGFGGFNNRKPAKKPVKQSFPKAQSTNKQPAQTKLSWGATKPDHD